MSIWSIILLVLIGAVCVYEIISFVITIIKRKNKAKQHKRVEVNNVIKESSEEVNEDTELKSEE